MAPPIWDWILVDGERRVLQTTPLEAHLELHPSTHLLAGGFGVDRTHRATWALRGDRLFLVQVQSLAAPSESGDELVVYSPAVILPGWPDGFAGWYTGTLIIRGPRYVTRVAIANGRLAESAESPAPRHAATDHNVWAWPVSIAVLTLGAGLVYYGLHRLLDGLSPMGVVGLLAVIVGARVILEGMAIAVRG